MAKFKISSGDCELLEGLERAGSIRELASHLRRDESVISRQVKALAEIFPVLEKRDKRWVLTAAGKRLTQWTRDTAESQSMILASQTTLTVATTREFSAKILIPNIKSLIKKRDVIFSVLTSDDGIENELLSGRADVGIDCGRPEDPNIKFKIVLPEPYVVTACPDFLGRHDIRVKENLLNTPHLRFKRDPAVGLLELKVELPNIAGSFNDLGSVRAACLAGLGWATLPRYTVQNEIAVGALKAIPGWTIQPRSFGVWWRRGQPSLEVWANETISWLGKQKV
jgi:DNA-binding transcriptional LysR family regulator